MRGRLFLFVAVVATAVALPSLAPATTQHRTTHTPTPAPGPTVIYHGSVSPLCAALGQHVKTVVGMMLQNDRTIAQSPGLLSEYNRDLADVSDVNGQNDPNPGSQAARDLTLYHLEQLVGPLANNVNAMQRELEDSNIFPANPSTDDERRLDQMRDELLKALAVQAVSLDVINGYVQTQQLAELQQEGTSGSDINAITNPSQLSTPNPATPDPMLHDPNTAGVAQNPYSFDPLDVPGITGSVGATPVTRLVSAMRWLQQETTRRENIASQTIIHVASDCATRATATPHPHPQPHRTPH